MSIIFLRTRISHDFESLGSLMDMIVYTRAKVDPRNAQGKMREKGRETCKGIGG